MMPVEPQDDTAKVFHRGQDVAGPLVTPGDNIVNRLNVITRVDVSLLLGLGRSDETESNVLIPCVDVALYDEERAAANVIAGFEETASYRTTVLLDNAAFITLRFSKCLEEACRDLRSVSRGDLKPDIVSVKAALISLDEARYKLQQCVSELKALEEELP